ncbi:MAG TPA: High-affinity nickel transporter [Thermoanaerobaculia bacterium]|nr:High-affinity nickel transporter [Thermoanaerobaculia bacterium]
MTPLAAMALAGLTAGLVHALSGPDHLAAVAPLALAGGRRWRAGLLWGAGHSAGLAAVAVAALTLRGLLPLEKLSSWSERLVGAALVAVGVWGLLKAFRGARRAAPPPAGAARAAFSIGALHGFAGSSHLLGLLPALALPAAASALYVGGFALGTVAAMGAFSSLVGAAAPRAAAAGRRAYPLLLGASSAAAVLVGGWWLVA